jgi:hypothetical protein
MLNHLIRGLAVGVLGVLAVGCGEQADTVAAGPAQTQDESELHLEPPSAALPPSMGQPLGDVVTFVDCAVASEHVAGALSGLEALTPPGYEQVCYIEMLDDDPRRYAGALLVASGLDFRSMSIVDVGNAGAIVVTATGTTTDYVSRLEGSDRRAPGGGYAEFRMKDGSAASVVRLSERRVQAIFELVGSDGSTVRLDVTAADSPKSVVRMARTLASELNG